MLQETYQGVHQTARHKPAATGTPQLVIDAQEVMSGIWVLGDTVGGMHHGQTAGRLLHTFYSRLHET